MSFDKLLKSNLLRQKSPNLSKLGFDFESKNLETEYLAVQDLLYRLYHIKMESMLTIMKMFNIPSTRTMDILFNVFDIESRSFSDATNNAYLENRMPINTGIMFASKQVWHTAWDGSKHFLRSTYELDFALSLDETKTKYEVENFRFKYFDKLKNKIRIAVPDFYLPSTNSLVEIKSRYWLDLDNMISKKEAYENLGFQFILVLDKKIVNIEDLVGHNGIEPL